jgi:hypothetical protein
MGQWLLQRFTYYGGQHTIAFEVDNGPPTGMLAGAHQFLHCRGHDVGSDAYRCSFRRECFKARHRTHICTLTSHKGCSVQEMVAHSPQITAAAAKLLSTRGLNADVRPLLHPHIPKQVLERIVICSRKHW